MTREDLKDLISMICNTEYEYRSYTGEKSKTKIISGYDGGAEKQALEKDMKVNKYLRELIRIGVMYENVNVEGLHVDEPKKEKDTDLRKKPVASYSLDSFDQLPMAAEEVKPYDRSN